ncbi:Putative GATA-binding transcription factor [Tolypocladium paradoxum]|uniref:GATA-binding transcription factor n=1 Tax=Tolypocladium paradoxum TaxID=94208 RepID=A0A2S4KPB2_9HYPO|nr:Putative GATA-binding transcription factor [Tolypocladium paradoxum]
MSIASLSPNHGLDSVPAEAASSPRRDGGSDANTTSGAQWTDADGRHRAQSREDVSGRRTRQPRSTSGTRRLRPGDGLGFQMIRRKADEANFPLFISRSPSARASPPPPPATSKALDKPTATATSTATTTRSPPDTPIATSKHSVRQVARNKQTSHHRHQQHHPHRKTDPPRKQRTDNARLECHACGTSETPEWRCGPDGHGTLCNVCGLVLAKKQRRKSGV